MTVLPDWDSLDFSFRQTDFMYQSFGDPDHIPPWDGGEIVPFGDISLSPAAAVLSYGCGVFEGLKAERSSDGRILLFRPDENGERFARSAGRLQLLPFPPEQFVGAVKDLVRANERFVPPPGKGTFYVRPMEHGIGPQLGLVPVLRCRVTMYGSPVGGFFKNPVDQGLRLKVLELGRAAPGGTGGAKAMGNYSGAMSHRKAARAEGFDDVLFLDSPMRGHVSETSGSNIFCLTRSGVIVTPELDETILPGITRDSVIRIARERLGIPVEERSLPVTELLETGREVFCTGTAWTVRSVSRIRCRDRDHTFTAFEVAARARTELRAIQSGDGEDPFGWTEEI